MPVSAGRGGYLRILLGDRPRGKDLDHVSLEKWKKVHPGSENHTEKTLTGVDTLQRTEEMYYFLSSRISSHP
jgi:hypothetical protein